MSSEHANPPQSDSPEDMHSMPPGIGFAYLFQMANTMSWSILLSMPMMLYLKNLEASATVLGVFMAMTPFLTILQIPAASYVDKVGYRKFVLWGWTLRTCLIPLMIIVVLLPPWIDSVTRMFLMLACLFFFTVFRGISSCGYLPWLSKLVPERRRGEFFSRDHALMFTTMSITSAGAGFLMNQYGDVSDVFSWILAASLMGAVFSLFFLTRMPDVETDPQARSGEPVPWGAILKHKPFRKFVVYNVVYAVAASGSGVIVVPMLKDQFLMSDGDFMLLHATLGVVFVPSALFMGKLLDQTGSRPMLITGVCFHIAHYIGWGLIGAKVLPFNYVTLGLQQFTFAFGMSMVSLSNARLLMVLTPETGRSHFLAYFSVATSLTMGLVPILWGLLVDILKPVEFVFMGALWNCFSIPYIGIGAIIISAIFFLLRVEEPTAMKTDEFVKELFVKTPARALTRVFPRRNMPT